MFWDIVPSVSSQIINDPRSLKEQLLDCLNDIEYILNEVNSKENSKIVKYVKKFLDT